MIYNKNVKESIYEGMKEMIEVVKKTLGPHGKNIVLDGYDTKLSSDGLTVAKAIKFNDRIKNIGRNLLVSGAELTKDQAGDGTTSTMILAGEFIKRVMDATDNFSIDLEDLEQIELAKTDIFKQLDNLAISNIDENTLKKVAFTASNDEEIATIVSKVVMEVKEYGYIGIAPTVLDKMYYEVINGLCYDKGYVSPFLSSESNVVIKDAQVVLVNDNITKITELEEIIKNSQKDLLIIALGYSKEVIDYMIYLNNSKVFNNKIYATLAPEYGNISALFLDDLADYLDTTVITTKTPYQIDKVARDTDYIEISKTTTIINKTNLNNIRLNKKINRLKEEAINNEIARKRLAILTNGIATIYLPSQKDYEYLVRKEKTFNAINSTIKSYQGKVIIGGGITLAEVYEILKNNFSYKNGKCWNNIYEAIISGLLVIKKTIDKNDSRLNYRDDFDNSGFDSLDSLTNMKIIINNSLYILRLVLDIDAIIVNEDEKQTIEEIF